MSRVTHEEWLQAAVEAFSEVSTQALGLPALEVVGRRNAMPRDIAGAFIPFAGEGDAAQIGFAGALRERQLICGALLQMPEEEALELGSADIADALGEVVNIAAGGIKSRLMSRIGGLALGLPMFINGTIEATDKLETLVADVKMGELSFELVLVRAREVT
jgi:hypothetical protein